MRLKSPRKLGLTFIEILVIVGIILVLFGIAIPVFYYFQKETDLNNNAEEIINALRLAQNKTVASEGADQFGVFFNTSTSPHQYILFKGTDYASRDGSFDEVHKLANSVRICEIDLADDGSEVIFDRIVGSTDQSGKVSLELIVDSGKTKSIYVESSGQVGLTNPPSPSDENRIKDSRHVHVEYSRAISTSTEKLLLTLGGGITETVIIAENLKDGQIYWEKEVDVSGDIQRIKIHSHRLNNPDTQFCIHRDRRYNNKSLKIDIDDSPDPDPGTLIEYSTDGLITTSTSIYVTQLQWQ